MSRAERFAESIRSSIEDARRRIDTLGPVPPELIPTFEVECESSRCSVRMWRDNGGGEATSHVVETGFDIRFVDGGRVEVSRRGVELEEPDPALSDERIADQIRKWIEDEVDSLGRAVVG